MHARITNIQNSYITICINSFRRRCADQVRRNFKTYMSINFIWRNHRPRSISDEVPRSPALCVTRVAAYSKQFARGDFAALP
jgi:hypothetical protein